MSGIRGPQVEQGADGIGTDNIVPGALAANALGRAIMAAAFFGDEATFSDKVVQNIINGDRLIDGSVLESKLGDGAITTSKLMDGILSADAAGRAKMATNFLGDTATFSAKVAAAVINGDRLLDLTIGIAKIIADLTFAKLITTGVKSFGFNGRVGAGQITGITGAVVGDRLFAVWRVDAVTLNATTLFSTSVTQADSIQQTSTGDLSAQRFIALLVPQAA